MKQPRKVKRPGLKRAPPLPPPPPATQLEATVTAYQGQEVKRGDPPSPGKHLLLLRIKAWLRQHIPW